MRSVGIVPISNGSCSALSPAQRKAQARRLAVGLSGMLGFPPGLIR